MSTSPEPIIKSIDLDDESKALFLEAVTKAYKDNEKNLNDLANELKKSLDDQLSGPWHVIVGKSFATSVSHEKQGFAYVYIGNIAIVCFKTV